MYHLHYTAKQKQLDTVLHEYVMKFASHQYFWGTWC